MSEEDVSPRTLRPAAANSHASSHLSLLLDLRCLVAAVACRSLTEAWRFRDGHDSAGTVIRSQTQGRHMVCCFCPCTACKKCDNSLWLPKSSWVTNKRLF